jgi:hypothetical protein
LEGHPVSISREAHYGDATFHDQVSAAAQLTLRSRLKSIQPAFTGQVLYLPNATVLPIGEGGPIFISRNQNRKDPRRIDGFGFSQRRKYGGGVVDRLYGISSFRRRLVCRSVFDLRPDRSDNNNDNHNNNDNNNNIDNDNDKHRDHATDHDHDHGCRNHNPHDGPGRRRSIWCGNRRERIGPVEHRRIEPLGASRKR